jgi:hypothetical protein
MEMFMGRALFATCALGAMVKQGSGKNEDFEDFAEKLFPFLIAPANRSRSIAYFSRRA